MNYLNTIFILVVAFLAVFAEAWFDVIRNLIGAQIDLLPALIVYTSLTNSIFSTATLAVCGGLWFDSISCNPLGVSILPLFLVGLAISQSRELLLRENAFAQCVLGGVASAICPLLTMFLILNIGHNPLLGWESLWQLFIMTLGGGLLTPICFLLFDRIHWNLNYQPIVETSFRADRQIKRGRN